MKDNWCPLSFFCFSKLTCFYFFQKRVAKGFIDAAFLLVCDSSCKLVRRTTEKIFWHFKLLTISSCSSTVATKWNTAAMKMSLLFESKLVLLIWFWGGGKLCHESQRKLKMQAFTAGYRKSFWPHLLAFTIASLVSLSSYYSFCLVLVLLSSQA